MTTSRAALRYAKALLLEADQQNIAEAVQQDMLSVFQTINESKDLQVALASPIIKTSDKRDVLLKVFESNSELTKGLIQVLAGNQRTDLLQNIAGSYINLYNDRAGIKEVEVTTAVALTPEMEKKVLDKAKELTQAKEVKLTATIDEKILGGFIIRFGDSQYDASVSNQLKTIKREFSKSL